MSNWNDVSRHFNKKMKKETLKCLELIRIQPLNKFRSKNVLKLHGLSVQWVFNMIFVWLHHIYITPHRQLYVKSLIKQWISNRFNQRPERFSNSQQRAPIGRWVKINKADIEYPFEQGEVINYCKYCTIQVCKALKTSGLVPLPQDGWSYIS
jgi:hypothetical protein